MSNSLTINTPNIVKQNTPLRNVPSGSTADSDYNVKYVPQTLTEEQQAQARENIGAAKAGQGGEQIQSDWDQTDTTAVDYIKNKPTIPAAQVNADWNASSGVAQILNKPTIPAAQIQSDWNQADTSALDYIKNKPTIPAAQVQADWNQTNTSAPDYIKNKPSESLELTMTDEDGNVITGTFVLSSKTITPAV